MNNDFNRCNYNIIQHNGVRLVQSGSFPQNEVFYGFSTRNGGVSKAPYSALNLGLSRDEPRENILRNFHILCDAFNLEYERLVIVNHEHGSNVIQVDSTHCGRGLSREPLPFCDGLITNDPSVTLVTAHADCGAIFLYDGANRAIGLAHAGWKGTLKRVGTELVRSMQNAFGTRPADLIAATGPCICFDCFEVGAEIGEQFVGEFGCERIAKPGRAGKAYVDIRAAIEIQLEECGILPQNISLMPLCTFERSDLFYSYRRDKAKTGAMVSVLKLI